MSVLQGRNGWAYPMYYARYLLPFLFFLFCHFITVFSQDRQEMTRIWDTLNQQYQSGLLNDTQFLSKGNVILNKYVLSEWMEENTTVLRSVLFSNKKYNRYRSEYFRHLGRNAVVFKNMGKGIFYYEQRDRALQNEPDFFPTLSAPALIITWTNKLNQTGECTRQIQKWMPFIDSLPQLMDIRQIPFSTLLNVHRILSIAVSVYQKLQDAAQADAAYGTLQKVHQATLRKSHLYPEDRIALLQNDQFFVEYECAKARNDTAAQEQFLRTRITDCKKGIQKGYSWAREQMAQTCIYLAYIFLDKNQLDSAQAYSQLYSAYIGTNIALREDQASNGMLLTQLEFKRGNVGKAYKTLLRTKEISDSLTDAQLFDMSNNAYAQTEAAYVKEALSLAQHEAENRRRWITAIIMFSGLALLLIGALLVKNRRRSQQMMQLLRTENQLQIAEMENKNSLALFEEQQRLGMQLHDTIAGDLLGIKMFLSSQVKPGEPVAEKIEQLKEMIGEAYTTTRKLSHEWFNGVAENIETGFLEKLNKIVDKLISPDRYVKDIYVDPAVFSVMPGAFRVQLLHIIQEALYNIVKHTQATKISIRLTREVDVIMLTIKDNGVGFNVHKMKKGVGLESMQERVKKILGTMEIYSDQNGTTLKFIF